MTDEPAPGSAEPRASESPTPAAPPPTEPPRPATAPSSSDSARTAPAAAPPAPAPVPSAADAPSSPSSPPAPQAASATRIIPPLVPTTPPPGPTSSSGPRTLTPKPVVWRSWPIVDSKLEPAVLILVVVGAVALVWRSTESPAVAALCGLAMAVTVWRQFVPTFFELSALGVTSRTLRRTRRVPWLSIDRYVIGKRGVFLSSAGAPLEALRGLYLPWSTHRDEVLASLRYYLPRAEEVKS